MISGIIFTLGLLITVALLVLNKNKLIETSKPDRLGYVERKVNFQAAVLPALILLTSIIFSAINPYKLEKIDSGYVGIKVDLVGNDRGVSEYQYKTGWIVYNSWFENVFEYPVFTQHIEYGEQNVITKGGFATTIKPTFNYKLHPNAVGDMFVNLRLDVKQIEQSWLQTAIIGSVNDVANRWNIDSIFNYREQFEASISVECNKRISKWFEVSQLRTNIVPPQPLQQAILNKTKAIQDVQVAENRKRVAEAEAERKIAEARGDSAQSIINASAEALSFKIKQKELTPLYVEYLKIQKWDGATPTVVSGGAGSLLVNVK